MRQTFMEHIDKLSLMAAAANAHPMVERYRQIRKAAHAWMFATGTRGIELLNAMALLVWGLALLDDRLLVLYMYLGAGVLKHPMANEALSAVFLIAALFALAGLLRKDLASDKLASFALQIGGLMWACVALNFMATYPPLNTGVGVYGLLAFFSWSAGCYLWDD